MIFKKDRNTIQSIAFMSIMVALIVVLNLLTTFFPYLFFLIVFIVPFVSLVITLTCKKIYIPIFLISSIGICLVSTIWNFQTTLFYITPALISGFILGFCIDKKWPQTLLIFFPSIIYFGFTYLSVPIIEAVYKINIINAILETLKLIDKPYIYDIVPSTIFLFSFLQAILSYMIIRNYQKQLEFELIERDRDFIICSIFALIFLLISIILIFFNTATSLLMMCFFIIFSSYCIIVSLINLNKLVIVLDSIFLIISIVLFLLLYKYFDGKKGMILIGAFFLLGYIVSLVQYKFKKTNN